MSATPIDIQIFGRSLRVNCPPEQQEALYKSAEDLNKRLQDLKERTRVTNTEQLIFIAALNVCHELTQEKAKNHNSVLEIEDRIKTLLNTVEMALSEQNVSSSPQNAIFE